jgi:hypothetical protein
MIIQKTQKYEGGLKPVLLVLSNLMSKNKCNQMQNRLYYIKSKKKKKMP